MASTHRRAPGAPPSPHRAGRAARLALALALILGAAAAQAAGAPAAEAGAWVRLRDQRVLELRAPRGEVPPEARARDATRALQAAVEADRAAEPSVTIQEGEALLRVGAALVLRLGPEDATAEALSLADLAAREAAALRQALAAERRRLRAHDLVYAFSMVVFGGLVALVLIRRVGAAALAAADRLEAAGTPVPSLTLGGVEVLGGPAVRGAAAFGLRVGRHALQLALALAWALAALSQFEATRGARDLLVGALVDPLLAAGARLAGGLPLAVGLAVALGLAVLLAHAAGVYFDAVGRGEAASAWLPRPLAPALGRLARAGVLLAALLVVAALVGGDGLLAGLARAVVLGLGLAAAPLAASALAGLPLLLGGRLQPGDDAEVGGQRGRVVLVGALATELEEAGGGRVLVPHLLTLFRPTRVARRDAGGPR